MFVASSPAAAAGGALTLYADDGTTVMVIMSDATKVRREVGVRTLKVSSSVLIPGLRVEASGRVHRRRTGSWRSACASADRI